VFENETDQTMRSRPELLGMVPYLLRYHPADSTVGLFVGADRFVRVASRADLNAPPAQVIGQWARAAQRVGAASVVVIGYGSRTAAPRIRAVADGLAAHLPVVDVLLACDGQYFCLRCPCPAADGVAFDPAATVAAARFTLAGEVALPSREDLLAWAEPDPAEQAAVTAALQQLPADADPVAVLRYLMEQAADGTRLPTTEVARLARLLTDRTVRDAAWLATGTAMWQRDLWLDVTRRAPAGYVAGPASLAAWCCWRRGEELLAVPACRRALSDTPDYLAARLILLAITAGIPPTTLLAGWPDTTPTSGGQRP
jgi:hypothetical protein